MKNIKEKLIAFGILFLFLCVTFYIGYKQGNKPEQTTQYTQSDSLELVRIDSVKGIYQAEIDKQSAIAKSALKSANLLSKSNAGLKAELKRLLNDTNATCEQRLSKSLFLNDSLQIEIDTLNVAVKALDIEAQTYSQKLYETEKQVSIEIKRFNVLLFKMDSTIVLYRDSLTNVKNRVYSGFIKRQWKLINNEYREYIISK